MECLLKLCKAGVGTYIHGHNTQEPEAGGSHHRVGCRVRPCVKKREPSPPGVTCLACWHLRELEAKVATTSRLAWAI